MKRGGKEKTHFFARQDERIPTPPPLFSRFLSLPSSELRLPPLPSYSFIFFLCRTPSPTLLLPMLPHLIFFRTQDRCMLAQAPQTRKHRRTCPASPPSPLSGRPPPPPPLSLLLSSFGAPTFYPFLFLCIFSLLRRSAPVRLSTGLSVLRVRALEGRRAGSGAVRVAGGYVSWTRTRHAVGPFAYSTYPLPMPHACCLCLLPMAARCLRKSVPSEQYPSIISHIYPAVDFYPYCILLHSTFLHRYKDYLPN